MASLLKDPLLEVSGQGPAPDKTFYCFTVTKAMVIWRWWKISLRAVDRNARPGETKQSHQDMLQDIRFQDEISIVFGPDVLEQAKSLCKGHFNFLEKLPEALLLRIMGFLELEDVGQLMHTSRHFWRQCTSEEFWESAVRQRCTTLSEEMVSVARDVGWCRFFFLSKIQVQLLIHRRSWMKLVKELEETSGGQSDTGDASSALSKSPGAADEAICPGSEERPSSSSEDDLCAKRTPPDTCPSSEEYLMSDLEMDQFADQVNQLVLSLNKKSEEESEDSSSDSEILENV